MELTNPINISVSIIIVNYRTPSLTLACIDSIYAHTKGVNFEVIVVDNHSEDDSVERLSKDNRIILIESLRNGGFGYGNNLGMRVAHGKYFFLLNSDTLLVNNAIKEFYDYAESYEPRTLYGCYLIGDDGTYRGSFHYFPALTIGAFFRRLFRKQNYTPDYTDKEVECICGADMFIPRTAIEECGGFDENIFLYGEEGELQLRMAKAGYKRMLLSAPKIIHLEGKSLEQSDEKRKIMLRSHFYVLKKYMNYPTYLLARMYYYIRK